MTHCLTDISIGAVQIGDIKMAVPIARSVGVYNSFSPEPSSFYFIGSQEEKDYL